MFMCYVCEQSFRKIEILIGHMKIFHHLNLCSQFVCKQNNCVRNFQSIYSFKRHLQSKHNNEPHNNNDNNNAALIHQENNPPVLIADDLLDHNLDIEDNDVAPLDANELNFEELVKQYSASFIAKLYSNNSITRSLVQDIVSDTSELLGTGFLTVLKNEVFRLLRRNNDLPALDLQNLERMFAVCETPFCDLQTEYMRFKFFRNSGNFIEPRSYIIKDVLEPRTVDGQLEMVPTPLLGQIIPMRSVLKQIFELPGTLPVTLMHMEHLYNNRDVLFENIIQGSLWHEKMNNEKFVGKTVLPLVIYFDDYEINNALGGHAGVHKMGAVYFTLPCIPQHLLSKLNNIFLALLFHSSDRTCENGNRLVFQPLIEELIYLENEGISVNVNGEVKQVYFALSVIIGDNLGLHSILGFTESFSANYSCRFCKVHKEVMHHQVIEDPTLLRTEMSYAEDLQINNVRETGIIQPCIWNDIPTFHVTKNFVCDIMHDLFEGVCRYDMSHIILHYCDSRILTFQIINDRIEGFNYGRTELNNKPPSIRREKLLNNTLGFSASEMLCFVRYFGLMIGDLIPVGDPVWDLYLTLRQIVGIVTMRSFQKGCINLLRTLVSEHNEMYVALFNDSLKPKHHLLVHYPHIISQVGPLIHLWCMRFEAKHKEFKIASHVTTSRRNIPYTLCVKHQLKLCYKLLSKNGFASSDVGQIGPGEYTESIKLNFIDPLMLPDDININCNVVAWVEVRGTSYKPDMVLVTSIENDGPIFGIIKTIVMSDLMEVYFICELIETVFFYAHVHAYQVELTATDKNYSCLSYKELPTQAEPAHLIPFNDGNYYVCLRSEL